jgi:hypothetical protein
MSNVKLTKSKANPTTVVVENEEWHLFSAEYLDEEGKKFGINFYGKNFKDAAKRVRAMKNSMELDGQVVGFAEQVLNTYFSESSGYIEEREFEFGKIRQLS